MSNAIENGNYCVYVHTSPSGKRYVGQTMRSPEQRWGKNGIQYLNKKIILYIYRYKNNCHLEINYHHLSVIFLYLIKQLFYQCSDSFYLTSY